ncbi:hypothetical protein L5515_008240 [Caenorhabditis briggsae]|uniref:peptidyl-tRNA hydrolase n=1 Tax=Caenorhabditis briggsae TaxID=6238 RepID=A0AAE9D2G1_CAEBR|nr:hypothetical protein L3Y34_008392 [Caenorhabditis briggsae]UMM35767.1 hypothetical protein L5515_008240 [Caenorhabditis briggsae]
MSRLKFVRVGLPFFALVLGSAYGLHFFQQVKFDFRKIKQEDDNLELLRSDLTKSGVRLREGVTVDSVYKEVAALDTDNWENIRGPRDTEDLTEYNRIKKQQQEASHLGIDNPPEPDNASIRAERGSPTPSSVTVDNAPSLPDRSFSNLPINDPFSSDIPEVPIPSSALSLSSQALSDPVPTPSDTSRPGISQNDEQTSNIGHPTDPQEPNEVNNEYLAHLLDLGFDEYTAELSLKRTNNTGVEQAVAWIVERSNESDFDDDSSSSENEVEEMGAVQSTYGRTHKMVLVANMSLKMGTGKLAAQVGHATLAVYRQAMNSEAGQNAVAAWSKHGQVKIVLKGQSTEQLMDLCKAAKDAGCFYYLVQDAGYTQIPPGSRTVLGIFGTVEQVDSVTGGLKLL